MTIKMVQLFWFGVYKDYAQGIKVAQISTTVDGLSCEILANPGMIELSAETYREAVQKAKKLAAVFDCSILVTGWSEREYRL